MNKHHLTRAGIGLVTCAAVASVFISQGALAQGGREESGFAALIGRGSIRPSDPRFQPAAVLVMNEATEGRTGPGKGSTVIAQTVLVDFFQRYVVHIPQGALRGGQPRALTASEAVFLEELFSQDLSKSRGTEIDRDGLSGSIRPQDLSIKTDELMAKAKARAAAKSKWYDTAGKGLGPG